MNTPPEPFEQALRETLADRARNAPDADPLVRRILRDTPNDVRAMPTPTPPRWRGWSLPLLAAACVVAVLAAVLGIEGYYSTPNKPVAAQTSTTHRAPTQVTTPAQVTPAQVTPAEVTPQVTVTVTAAPTHTGSAPRSTSATGAPTSPAVAGPVALTKVRVLDLSFAGIDDGWALASADCLSGAGRCAALLRTTDGATWHGMQGAVFNVAGVHSCADPCVEHVRFATDRIGYAFGRHALLMTTDGGLSWTRLPGGADALEIGGGTVIAARIADCGAPPCPVTVHTMPVGARSWTAAALPNARVRGSAVAIVRNGSVSDLLVTGAPPGTGSRTSAVFTSQDGGSTWGSPTDPCSNTAGSGRTPTADAIALAVGVDGGLAVLCRQRNATTRTLAVVGAPPTHSVPGGDGALLAGDPSTVLVVGGSALLRTTDRGRTWSTAEGFSDVTFVGFESPTVGRVIADGGRTVWTTRDAGRSWTQADLAS